MRKLPYQSSLQFIQRPQLLWNEIGDRKLWRGIQWIRRGPTVPSRLSWNAYQSNIPKPRSGVRWKHGMRRFSEYGNVASRNIIYIYIGYILGISIICKRYIYICLYKLKHINLHFASPGFKTIPPCGRSLDIWLETPGSWWRGEDVAKLDHLPGRTYQSLPAALCFI